jgi:hypothetical protein
MDTARISAELAALIDELDERVGFVLRDHGRVVASDVDRHLRPLEALADELYFEQRCDERSMRVVREAIIALRAICVQLPLSLEDAVGRSTYDRLRALRTDLDLGLI